MKYKYNESYTIPEAYHVQYLRFYHELQQTVNFGEVRNAFYYKVASYLADTELVLRYQLSFICIVRFARGKMHFESLHLQLS